VLATLHRIVCRDYPLIIHRTGKRAAEAAHCADEQGKFWPMHDRLFSKGGPITDADIARFAQQAKLDQNAFDACLGSGGYKEAWKPSQDEGTRVGVTSTPSFFINGRMIVGAPPVRGLRPHHRRGAREPDDEAAAQCRSQADGALTEPHSR